MNSYDYNGLPDGVYDAAFDRSFAILLLSFAAVAMLVGLVLWIIRSGSLRTVARRRGIRNTWLAWLPVGYEWVLGAVSDQYRHLARGRVNSRRKVLAVLAAVMYAANLACGTVVLLSVFEVTPGEVFLPAGVALLCLSWGVNLAATVFHHIGCFDLYRSCDPQNAVVYLLLGIILPVTEPFFYFSCRRKDLGFSGVAPGF